MPKAHMGRDLLRLAGKVVWGRKSLAQSDPWLHRTVDTLAVIPSISAGMFRDTAHMHVASIPGAKLECGEAAAF